MQGCPPCHHPAHCGARPPVLGRTATSRFPRVSSVHLVGDGQAALTLGGHRPPPHCCPRTPEPAPGSAPSPPCPSPATQEQVPSHQRPPPTSTLAGCSVLPLCSVSSLGIGSPTPRWAPHVGLRWCVFRSALTATPRAPALCQHTRGPQNTSAESCPVLLRETAAYTWK